MMTVMEGRFVTGGIAGCQPAHFLSPLEQGTKKVLHLHFTEFRNASEILVRWDLVFGERHLCFIELKISISKCNYY